MVTSALVAVNGVERIPWFHGCIPQHCSYHCGFDLNDPCCFRVRSYLCLEGDRSMTSVLCTRIPFYFGEV